MKRFDQEQDESLEQGGTVVAAETLRSAAAALARAAEPRKEEEKISLFWRVFGGTILSITALVVITLYNGISGSITDLRNELGREREARTGLAKKDEMDARAKAQKDEADTRSRAQYDRIRVVEGYKADIEALRERVGSNVAAVETAKKDFVAGIDGVKKDTAGLELLKERVTAVEAVKKDVAGIDAVKERLTTLATDLKAARDEVQKLQQELEKNKASDLERKTYRDAQSKQLDETLKDLQKGLQACREKLARLEGGQQQAGPPSPTKPAPKGETAKPVTPPDE